MQKKPLIVGITGKARAGKDTVATILQSKHRCHAYSFAGPIKSATKSIFGEFGDSEKENIIPGFDFTYRKAMQTLGTEWGRDLDCDLWLKLAKQQYERACEMGGHILELFIIPDVRFDNEANWIKLQDGIIIEVRRDSVKPVEKHSSEEGLSIRPDFVASNNGSIDELEGKIDQVMYYAIEN